MDNVWETKMLNNILCVIRMTGMTILTLTASVCIAAESTAQSDVNDLLNYSAGYQVGSDFAKQGVEPDPEMLTQGVWDAIQKKNKPRFTQEQMNKALTELRKKSVEDQQVTDKRTAAEHRKASAAFLKENAVKEGVMTLPSGVQYKVLKAGSGKKPTLHDEVRVHYRIAKIDGKEVASTYVGGKPRSYPLTKAIPGLQEVLPLMSEGAKWQIVLPATATGGREPLDDMGVMIYEMELISVLPATRTNHGTDTLEEKHKGEQSPQ